MRVAIDKSLQQKKNKNKKKIYINKFIIEGIISSIIKIEKKLITI